MNIFIILPCIFLARIVTGIPENFEKFNLDLKGDAASKYSQFIGTYVLVNDILLRGREVWEHFDEGKKGNRERHVVGCCFLTFLKK